MTGKKTDNTPITSTLLTTQITRFHTLSAARLRLPSQEFPSSIVTVPFDREAVIDQLRQTYERPPETHSGHYMSIHGHAHHLYTRAAVVSPQELRLLLRFLTHPRIFEGDRQDSAWIEKLDEDATLTAEDAFELTASHYRRAQCFDPSKHQHTQIHALVIFPVLVLSRLYPLDDVLEFALRGPFSELLLRQVDFENCKLRPLDARAKARISSIVADAMREHSDVEDLSVALLTRVVESLPSKEGLAIVLEKFCEHPRMPQLGELYIRLMRIIEDRALFDHFVYESLAIAHFQPLTALTQIARWGLEDCGTLFAQIEKRLAFRWGKEHWNLIFHLHMPEVTPLVLEVIASSVAPQDRMHGRALRWLRREGANAMSTLVEHLLDDSSAHQDLAAEILVSYAERGHEDLLREHLKGDHEIFERIERPQRRALKLHRELTYEEMPDWLQYWSKRGLAAPYPPSLPKTAIEPLETEEGAYLGKQAMLGVMRLLQEASKRNRPEVEMMRAYFTEDSRDLLALILQGIWACQDSPSQYQWMVTAGALLGQETTIDMLRSEMHQRGASPGSYYYYAEQPRWVQRALSCHPDSEGLRLLFDDWMWRRKQRRPAVWRDSALERAARERGQSYFGMIENMLPELGIARNGKCHFEEEGLSFCYELDGDDDVLLSQYREGAWREVSIYHPNSAHSHARRRAKKEVERLSKVYTELLLEAMAENTEWKRFEWVQGLNHPVIRSRRQRVLWQVEDDRGDHVKFVRVCEDGSLADIRDDVARLPANCTIKPARWSELPGDALIMWSTLFAEHEVVALGR